MCIRDSCLTREEIFKTQLRAILRASAFGNISVMFPMIISVEEVKRAKAILEEVKAELKMHGMAYKDIEIGVMIETPASVMISEELAEDVYKRQPYRFSILFTWSRLCSSLVSSRRVCTHGKLLCCQRRSKKTDAFF